MFKSGLVVNEVRFIFHLLGFAGKEAYVNVCMELDHTLSAAELLVVWDLGVMTHDIEQKIAIIIDKLKQE